MKRFATICLVGLSLMLTSFVQNITPLSIGATMPMKEVKMKDVSGKMVSLADAATSKGLLVMFSCNTCPWVVKYQSRTREMLSYAQRQGLGVIIINSNEDMRDDVDSYEAMQTYARNQEYIWSYVVDVDSKLADAFGATRTPENFLFNSKGVLVYHGGIDDNANDANGVTRKHLKEAIDEMTSGREVSVKQTRSVGCTIKRKE